MKTIEELYNEVVANEELKKEFITLKADEVEDFAKAHGCEATLDEIKDFFKSRKESGELSDAELSQVSGGKSDVVDVALESIATLGLFCLMI